MADTPLSTNTLYETLEPGQIRLLEFDRQASSASVLCFRFRTTRLGDTTLPPPRYTAISYTWGDAEASEEISIDGSMVKIRPNLQAALTLVTSNAASDHRYDLVWADAICIDQLNTSERNAQVAQMDKVYSEAAAVSVWLGDSLTDSSIQKVMDRFVDAWKRPNASHFFRERMISRCAYWSRAWVTQEITLAKDLVMYTPCGVFREQEFLHHLQNRASYLRKWPRPRPRLNVLSPIAFLYPYIGADFGTALGPWNTRQSFTFGDRELRHLLKRHANSKCSDPRDRVFSLLGLLRSLDAVYISRILPDYNLTLKQVLIVVLLDIIRPIPFLHWEDFLEGLEGLGFHSLSELPLMASCVADLLHLYSNKSSSSELIRSSLISASSKPPKSVFVPSSDVVKLGFRSYLRYLNTFSWVAISEGSPPVPGLCRN